MFAQRFSYPPPASAPTCSVFPPVSTGELSVLLAKTHPSPAPSLLSHSSTLLQECSPLSRIIKCIILILYSHRHQETTVFLLLSTQQNSPPDNIFLATNHPITLLPFEAKLLKAVIHMCLQIFSSCFLLNSF